MQQVWCESSRAARCDLVLGLGPMLEQNLFAFQLW